MWLKHLKNKEKRRGKKVCKISPPPPNSSIGGDSARIYSFEPHKILSKLSQATTHGVVKALKKQRKKKGKKVCKIVPPPPQISSIGGDSARIYSFEPHKILSKLSQATTHGVVMSTWSKTKKKEGEKRFVKLFPFQKFIYRGWFCQNLQFWTTQNIK